MSKKFSNTRVAFLLCSGFEESEMTQPRAALEKAGIKVDLISPESKKIRAWFDDAWSKSYKIDKSLKQANPADYDALVLPGGVLNPDTLRADKNAVKFVKSFLQKKKIVAAICHGPLTLVETKMLKGFKMTSYHSIKTDLKNAGAIWQNKQVVRDRNLITSRQPKDIPAFNKAILKALAAL